MATVYVKYNPYRLQTEIKINGRTIETDNTLYQHVKGKRLQEWIGSFPEALKHSTNSVSFDVTFYGMEMDWDDFEFAFLQAKEAGIINEVSLTFEEGRSSEDITDKIVGIFHDLREGPVEAFRDERLLRAFENIRTAVFPINVIATMSSGKSTLINALLAYELMPSKNQACTATITEITDNDKNFFQAITYNKDGEAIQSIDRLTYEIMDQLNDDENVQRIAVDGDIPFIDADDIALQLVDTPGPNNSQNQAHKNTTYSAIKNGANNLILYVLNGTQMGINDDAALLDYVAEQIREGGKQVRDRFLFVVNKMDGFDPDKEDIGKAIDEARNYLAKHGIADPQIFPCSAYTALNIRTHLKDIDIGKLTMDQMDDLPTAAIETISKIRKFNKFDAMHLEKYSVLPPSTQRDIDFHLNQAVEAKDTKEQALIHCGILSIEAAIIAYVKKYAQTRKVKDLVDSFQEVLESSQVLANAKTRVAEDEEVAKACIQRAEAIRAKIADGSEAKKFKERIASFDPMEKITNTATKLQYEIEDEVVRIFQYYDDTLTNKNEAKRMITQFRDTSQNCMAKLSAELESIINKEIVETGEMLLLEYQEKLTHFDSDAAIQDLDFNTVDLVKDALQTMRNSIEEWRADSFVESKIEEVGTTTTETKTYYEKVGEEEEEIAVGTHEEKIGTKKVKTGSHQEYAGKKTVKNPNKSWWQIWKSSEIEEDVYVTVDDYKEEDVYKTVTDYKTVIRDVFEERSETIEKYSAQKDVIQTSMLHMYRLNLDNGITDSLKFAEDQIGRLKQQFSDSFDELDKLITDKYAELEACANDQKQKEEELKRSRDILAWIESNKKEMDEILDI